MAKPTSPIREPDRRHTAGILDIRNIIGALLGVYGVILVLMGLFGDQEGDKTGDVNANLWAGLAMVAASVVFIAWARLRPIRVPVRQTDESAD
jgi:drug/metabolite transporter (DMT)-like permease